MAIITSSGKQRVDFNLVIPLRDQSGNIVHRGNQIEIEPRYTDGSTAASKNFSASGDYQDSSNHNTSGSGWSYDFKLEDLNTSGGRWYNYTYGESSGRRGSSSSPSNHNALSDWGSGQAYASLYLDLGVGTGPHPGLGTAYCHMTMLTNNDGQYHQYMYTNSATPNYSEAKTLWDHNSTNQNIKISGQRYSDHRYRQLFCMGSFQNWGSFNVRLLRIINWGGGTSQYSKLTVAGGQWIIHGRTGEHTGTDI